MKHRHICFHVDGRKKFSFFFANVQTVMMDNLMLAVKMLKINSILMTDSWCLYFVPVLHVQNVGLDEV